MRQRRRRYRSGRRAARAARSAAMLDEIVDARLPLLAGMDEDARRQAAERMAELVLLAQDYRQYGRGWIGRTELYCRTRSVAAGMRAHRGSASPSSAGGR